MTKILHFEDDEMLGAMYKAGLEKEGIEVKHLLNPPKQDEDLIRLVLEEKPDLIIMDIIMPEMDGFKATEILKSNLQTKDIPIFGLDNLSQEEYIKKAIKLGMTDYWVKACYPPSEIVNMINDFLAYPKEYKLQANKTFRASIFIVPPSLITARNDKPVGKDVEKNQAVIERFLKDFGIDYKQMNKGIVGSSITTYTFELTENDRIQKVLTLSNNFAMTLDAHPIRIEAPIPGTHFIGIEVPNTVRTIVGLREELINEDYEKQNSNLTICLGRNYENKSYYVNLTDLPHLLIVGATNSGKSNFLHSLIVSLLTRHRPQTLQFVLVDPKRIEFPFNYASIPHLLVPAITEVGKTLDALKLCINEMDMRFVKLNKKGVSNIKEYNKKNNIAMPYIIFIVDEMSDLMVAAGKEAEDSIIKLVQKAATVGIHLILATSRPSTDVVTGTIKANIPARLAFSTASSVDSLTILDLLGAERLIGRGDALFKNVNSEKLIRLQMPYISDEDIKKIVDSLKK